MTYTRTGKMDLPEEETPARAGGMPEPTADGGYRINGFQQVLDLLRAADLEFRASLLRRIGEQDPELARALIAELK